MEQGRPAELQQPQGAALTDPEEAVIALGHAALREPGDPRLSRDLGEGLCGLRLHKFGVLQFDNAVARAPGDPSTYLARGRALAQLGELEAAIADMRQAIALDPAMPLAHAELGSILSRAGYFDEAMRLVDEALALNPAQPGAHELKSVLLLAEGRFEEGWPEYEWRARGSRRFDPASRPPWWQGARDKRLLVCKEQGPGEQILFGSVLPELDGFAHPVTVQLDARLIPLFERSMAGLRFIDKEQPLEAGEFDEQVAIGSLASRYRPDLAAFARARRGFLVPDAMRTRELHARLHTGGRRACGVSWRSRNFLLGEHKSLPLEQLAPLLRTPGFDFVDLQYGDSADERANLQATHGIELRKLHDVDNLRDLDGLAALIAACDVVVTSSNTTAHLAGALGVPTMLLSARGRHAIWYWVAREGRSLWYPGVRVLTQDRPGDWAGCVEQARVRLEDWPWTT